MQNLQILDVTAENGVDFRVLVVTKSSDESETKVEFYDRRFAHTVHGQFTGARYYLSTMLEHSSGAGLDLYGGVADWTLDSVTFRQIRDWLQFLVDREAVRV
ncbi:hypothetical protein SEA_FAUST_247 [Streptomyces phage Faust]|uniref:Uncharacterized protein n=1 Tax=Streptomyces phage Faust TaxID=2767565 RepID=A0A7G9UZ64_9CAUD|nr:hypothetical protein PP456_gp040 [Streptomyces phage Faust]QNN99319.1 hypothetical protein SEA_FAUST_247 [Streptomyces phage Faust]